MTVAELRQDAARRQAQIAAAIEYATANGGTLRYVECDAAAALAQVERDRLLADCVEALTGYAEDQRCTIDGVPWHVRALLARFAAQEIK